jgi:transposase
MSKLIRNVLSILGIDVSKDKLDVVLLQDGGYQQATFDNNKSGFRALVKWLKKQRAGIVHVCMEATGTYHEGVAEYLYLAGHQVSVVNPARTKAYGDSLLKRSKTDRTDARVIADFCLAQNPRLWAPPDPALRELRAMTRRMDDLVHMRQQERTRRKSGVGSSTIIRDLKKHITFLDKEIKALEGRITEHVRQHPELLRLRDLLVSIPGIGHKTACTLIAEIQDIEMFDHPKQLAAYAGVDPRQYRSGSSIRGRTRMSKKGDAQLRAALFYPAMVAKRHNPIVRAAAQRHVVRGNCKMSATGVAMRMLLHIVYGVWKSEKPFDANHLSKSPISA